MISKSKFQTQKFAEKLVKKILKNIGSRVVCLSGELGSGKTTFAQGFAKGLGIKAHITSPTFLIIRRHPIQSVKRKTKNGKQFKNLYHLDLYHINNQKEILNLGFKRIISDSENIVLIEWPERIKKILPKNSVWIYLKHGKKENERIIK